MVRECHNIMITYLPDLKLMGRSTASKYYNDNPLTDMIKISFQPASAEIELGICMPGSCFSTDIQHVFATGNNK